MNDLITQHEQELHKSAYELVQAQKSLELLQQRIKQLESRMTELSGIIAALRHAEKPKETKKDAKKAE